MPIYKCEKCGKDFFYNRLKKFCSKECRLTSRKKLIECYVCKEKFFVKKSQAKRRKTCSKKCYSIYLKTKKGIDNPNWKISNIKKCNECGKEFKAYNKEKKYCSNKCYGIASTGIKKNISKQGKENIKLAQQKRFENYNYKKYYCSCGKELYSKKHKQCIECIRKNHIETHTKKCGYCGNIFIAKTIIGKFCSDECLSKYKEQNLLGSKNPNWKGGVKSINQIGRYTKKYYQWVNKVMERDNYTCQHCGQYGGKLNSHHILSWAKYPDKRLEISNGLTLCVDCHRKEHNWNMKES